MSADPTAKYLAAYAPELRAQVRRLIAEGRLAESLERRHPERHDITSDGALYDDVMALKNRHMRSAGPLAKVLYDSRLHLTHQALGTHTAVSRLQGGRLKAKREIRIASLFREAPAAFLRMIVVHELAHLKERAHDRAFYALCTHMLQKLQCRSKVGDEGFDAIGAVVVDCKNDGTPITLATASPPAPAPSSDFDYSRFVRRLAQLYATRFARI